MISKTALEQVSDYYHTRESRWGYQLVLGGAKHFGYYPAGVKGLTMRQAGRIMEDKLGSTIGLAPGSKVLDAGCGMGRVGTYLAKHFGYEIEGIDLLDFNITEAKRFAARNGEAEHTNFQIGDYSKLPFPADSFDAVYTMETFVHAPDFRAVLAEFRRVLKPGGRLILFEYTIAPFDEMDAVARKSFKEVIAGSAMHALPQFTHGSFPDHLEKAGFVQPKVADATALVVPMVRRFNQLAWLPYQIYTRTNRPKASYVNVQASVEWFRHAKYFRFVIVSTEKPQ